MNRVVQVVADICPTHPELNFIFSLSHLAAGEEPSLIEPGSTVRADIVLKAIVRGKP